MRSAGSVSLICGIRERRKIFCASGSAMLTSRRRIATARCRSGSRAAKSGRKKPESGSICPHLVPNVRKRASFRFREMPRKMIQFEKLGPRVPGSSTVEHSAVNRRVASSNLARGANLLNQLAKLSHAWRLRLCPILCPIILKTSLI